MQLAHRAPALWLVWLGAALVAVTGPAEGAGAPPPVAWRRSSGFPGLGPAQAVALDASGARVAVGDDDGAWLREGGPARRVVRRGPVRDLAFDRRGGLWVATAEGLFRRDAAGRVADRTPAPGAAPRDVRRVVVDDEDRAWVASAAGAWVEAPGSGWSRLDAEIPSGPVHALGVRAAPSAGPGAHEAWLIVGDALVRAVLVPGAGGLRVARVERPVLPEAARAPLDLVVEGDAVHLLARGSLSVRRGEGPWETRRPELPPGAEVRRLARAAGRWWIATDAGLVEARGARFVRAALPAGSTPVAALAGADGRVLAVGPRGVLEGRVAAVPASRAAADAGAASAPPAPSAAASEPSVQAVHRAALAYLDLHPRRVAALWRGVRWRGWLPRLSVGGGYGGGRSFALDHDETFTSGEPRFFVDREWDRERDFDVSATLTWDLGDVLYHPESIDVSRESRELVELRDDVLDEITQLYFERRRVQLELAGPPEPAGAEAARLRLRAAELAAGIDAWTGGYWSRATAGSSSSPPDPEREIRP